MLLIEEIGQIKRSCSPRVCDLALPPQSNDLVIVMSAWKVNRHNTSHNNPNQQAIDFRLGHSSSLKVIKCSLFVGIDTVVDMKFVPTWRLCRFRQMCRQRTNKRHSFPKILMLHLPASQSYNIDPHSSPCEPPLTSVVCVRRFSPAKSNKVIHTIAEPQCAQKDTLFTMIPQRAQCLLIEKGGESEEKKEPLIRFPHSSLRNVAFLSLSGYVE